MLKIRPTKLSLLGCSCVMVLSGLAAPAFADSRDMSHDKVFSMSNDVSQNAIVVYESEDSGSQAGLRKLRSIPTGGQGSGAYLGSQSAITLSMDGRRLYAVNAGSSTVSAFDLDRHDIRLTATTPSGGLTPISVAEHDGLVYVLNHGGEGSLTGFREKGGVLVPVPGSYRSIASGSTNPAQVGFSPDGDYLVVTERGTSAIATFPVNPDGTLGNPVVSASSGAVPFGFAFDRRAHLLVAEAAGSALSSYRLDEDTYGMPVAITASLKDQQASACWVAVTPNGHFAYVANTAANSISGYRIHHDGKLALLQSNGLSAALPGGSLPADVAVGNHGRSLFVFDRGVGDLTVFGIRPDGNLVSGSRIAGLPAGSTGLAAN